MDTRPPTDIDSHRAHDLHLDVALEITPPAAPKPWVLLRRARGLGAPYRRVNVIERPDRQSSLDASIALLEDGLHPVWHLANRGRSFAEVEALVARARRAGIVRVLCVRGEFKQPDDTEVDEPKLREIVRMLVRAVPDVHVSVTLNHHLPARRALANLWPKLAAGALGVQTQVTFDLESLRVSAEEIARRHPDVALTPMLMPVLDPAAALRVSRRLGVPVPASLLHRLDVIGEEAGWEHFTGLVRAIARSPLYRGVAVMTPIDPSAHFLRRLRRALVC